MRGPDADDYREAFDAWYALASNAQAFDRQVRAWDTTMFLANTATGKARNLDRARATPLHRSRWVIAASFTAVLAIGSALLVRSNTTADLRAPLTRMEAVALDRPPRHFSLPDGSDVVLDRGARLLITFDGKQRHLVLLAGKARFAVAHEDHRAFVVDAGTGSVIAHGTLFDVALMGRVVDVALLEGAVEVRNRSTGTGRKSVELSAGHKVAVTGGSIGEPTIVRPAERYWPADMIAFNDVDIVDAVSVFNRTSTAPLAIGELPSRSMKVTGAFKRSDPEGFARQLAATFGLEIERSDDGGLTLRRR
jgi:transmembrane sensor